MAELEVAPLYPGTLYRPDPVPLWYLDLKDWIGLARARLGRPAGERYEPLLDALRQAHLRGSIRVVLSNPLWQELSAIKAPQQREALVDVIDELTDFDYLAGQVEVMQLEIEASLNATLDSSDERLGRMCVVGRSLLYSFGMRGGLQIFEGDGTDITQQWRAQQPQQLAALERAAERMLLLGPADEEVPVLRAQGYRPEENQRTLRDNLAFDQDLAETKLDSRWRRGRLRDVIMARHLFYELNETLHRQLAQRGRHLDDLGETLDERREFVLRMPSQRVIVELKTSYHRNPDHRWTTNDLHDLDAMSLALPYCDVVLADAAVRSHVLRSGLNRLLNVAIPRTPQEAADLLNSADAQGMWAPGDVSHCSSGPSPEAPPLLLKSSDAASHSSG